MAEAVVLINLFEVPNSDAKEFSPHGIEFVIT